ncbi:DUF748 domain-containing protein [Geomonas sp. RF6]|uniref:DUF748 domain-containing protein n=1 Tax=Geomonas sp. RF6 TaxID=2897342 RepID=UPI001E2AD0A7|nr:DUF748 domain-containing protein [Geomonas sp. RF6]UFS71742.1 DUF748 domain-containing protein [Geomonas sp. RF6]
MAEQQEEKQSTPPRRHPALKVFLWIIGILFALIVILFIASFFLDEPIRRNMERRVNRDLKGYSVRIPGLHFQLINLSLTLKGMTVIQQAYPNPPVVYFPRLKASVHWREIFSGRVVGEFRLDQPRVNINLQQLQAEARSKVPVKQRGWQKAVEDIYPLKINTLTINDGSVTYLDVDGKNPISLTHVNLRATNIRNIHLPDKVYPSSFRFDSTVFGTGRAAVEGRANFLAEPVPGIKAGLRLEKVPIDRLKRIVARANLAIEGGILEAAGDVEYAPAVKRAHLQKLSIKGMRLDYIHSAKTAAAEERRAKAAKKAAKKVTNKQDLLLRVDELALTGCTLGMRNEMPGKRFRVFIADTDISLTNLSNNFTEGPAKAKLSGKFMGSGVTSATATFRPEKKGPDLDLYVKISNTQLTSMNDLLRAYGNFDVSKGTFSLVTELHVKNDAVRGYLKPFFKDMQVYDRRKDKDRSLFHQLYEMLVGGVAKLLENKPRQAVATKADISGPLEKPHTSTMQIVVQLIKNAFFRAILPTFERQVTSSQKR